MMSFLFHFFFIFFPILFFFFFSYFFPIFFFLFFFCRSLIFFFLVSWSFIWRSYRRICIETLGINWKIYFKFNSNWIKKWRKNNWFVFLFCSLLSFSFFCFVLFLFFAFLLYVFLLFSFFFLASLIYFFSL